MRGRSLTLSGEVAANLADAMLGGKRSVALVLALGIFSILLNLVSNGIGVFLPGWWSLAVGGLLLVLWVAGFRVALRWVVAGLKLRVIQDDKPAQYKVLIMFLSPVFSDRDTALAIADGRQSGSIRNVADRALFQVSWRMPLEAIAYHLGRLEKLIVLPSADSPGKQNGTHRDLQLFFGTIRQMCGADCPELLDVKTLGLADGPEVDFEKAEALVSALEGIYRWLRENKVSDYDILIDITGGQKVPTVAGASVALDVGRRIQYVSMRDYKVRTYDFTVNPGR